MALGVEKEYKTETINVLANTIIERRCLPKELVVNAELESKKNREDKRYSSEINEIGYPNPAVVVEIEVEFKRKQKNEITSK